MNDEIISVHASTPTDKRNYKSNSALVTLCILPIVSPVKAGETADSDSMEGKSIDYKALLTPKNGHARKNVLLLI
jgi:hypothetical protein